MRLKILIADDHEAAREGLKQLLIETPVEVCGAFACSADVVSELNRQDADAVLADVRMPGVGGLSLLAQLRETRPQAASGDVQCLRQSHVRGSRSGDGSQRLSTEVGCTRDDCGRDHRRDQRRISSRGPDCFMQNSAIDEIGGFAGRSGDRVATDHP